MFHNFDELPLTLNVREVADVLGVSVPSIYRLIEYDKTFPVINVGRRKMIPKDALKKWMHVG